MPADTVGSEASSSYEFDKSFPISKLPAGYNVLIAGKPMTGKRDLALTLLESGSRRGEPAVIISTNDAAPSILAEYDKSDQHPDFGPVGIVDCVTSQQGRTPDAGSTVKFASSPGDLTGIGIAFSDIIEFFYTKNGYRRNRICFDTVSTLLQYGDTQRVFRFLHVLTGRVSAIDGISFSILHTEEAGGKDENMLKQLFDAVIYVRENDDGDREVRVVGVPETSSEWTPYPR